ncbi:MAG: hypothetical protein WC374_08770 [Phycisphaerae bacterium]|jgi:hypothetical protein
MWNIFEQPWTLLTAAVISALIIAVVLVFIKSKYKSLLWLIPLLIAALAFILDYEIDTDREKIIKTTNTAVKAVEEENCDALAACIAEDYADSAHRDKAALMLRCRSVLRPPLIYNIIDSILDMQITGSTAEIELLNRVLFDEKSDAVYAANAIVAKVKINFRKQPSGDWLITNTEILTINGRPAKWTSINYPNW